MNDQIPMFDDPPSVEMPPKKPRKPMRRKAKKVAAPKPVKKRRKRRIVNKVPFQKEKQSAVRPVPSHVYEVIGMLMNLELPLRKFVMEVAKALTK